jgi:hypothetical protein
MDTEKNPYDVAFERATNPEKREDFWYLILAFNIIQERVSSISRMV